MGKIEEAVAVTAWARQRVAAEGGQRPDSKESSSEWGFITFLHPQPGPHSLDNDRHY